MKRMVWTWAGVLVLSSGCPQPAGTESAGGGASSGASTGGADVSGGDKADARVAGTFAVPQEELVKNKDAIKVTGVVSVKDFPEALVQIDVTPPTTGNVQPITVARFKKPGPIEFFLPPTVTEVNLTAILDLKGNGPDAEDPKAVYSGNPLKISGKEVSGIEIVIDSSGLVAPPPSDPGTAATPAQGEAVITAESTAAGTPSPAAAGAAAASPTAGSGSAAPAAASTAPAAASTAPATRPVETRATNVPDVLDPSKD